MQPTTLIAAPLEPRHSQFGAFTEYGRIDPSERHFTIESADSFVVRQSTNSLLQDRYGWRGYQRVTLPANQTANRTTLTAIEGERVIGTITVGLDSAEGMNCEDAFAFEVATLRKAQVRVCEFTKLAVDPVAGTKRVLAGLFHVAYLVAHRLRQYDALVMEVNPRHVRYYERMLGARVIGSERLNRSVHAPAVLLGIDFDYIAAQIRALGGHPEFSATDRTLYPLAFTAQEEEGIVARLMRVQKAASDALN
ncbi:MAG: long-chain N-acyl amino acid synthase [Burkholderiales bacterium]|nr:long-chain N-acyl amino acid synthase [Burkholderiales bacterium]MDE1925712.1 long-chain N-acyl amino acid synthase [Burkholderiales bacterium]MDE2160396.1 long-chain N-acyl amino acid synthase [Burkholderiales bacterium]